MKHITKAGLFAFIFGAVLWPVHASAQAQSGCRAFQAIAQATLPGSTPLGLTLDIWGGPVYVMLGDEFLFGVMTGHDGMRESNANVGQKRDGFYTVGFRCQVQLDGKYVCQDTFTYHVANTVYTQLAPAVAPGFGQYHGNSAKIVSGTGRFRLASGNLNVNGPFIAWPDATSPLKASGRWNPELTGFICGVE
jgi:hypothetical protein